MVNESIYHTLSVWLCKYLYLESIISCLHVFANISPKLPKNFTLKKIQGVFTPLPRQLHPPKTNMTIEKTKNIWRCIWYKKWCFSIVMLLVCSGVYIGYKKRRWVLQSQEPEGRHSVRPNQDLSEVMASQPTLPRPCSGLIKISSFPS